MITKCQVYLMFYSMYLLLDPSPFPPEDVHGHSWEEGSGAKSIGKAISPCRVYRTAKDNTVITANPTQVSNPDHSWGQDQGQMVFFYAERDKEATGSARKPLSGSLWSQVNPTGARSPIGLVWILGSVPVVSAKRQATSLKSHCPLSK